MMHVLPVFTVTGRLAAGVVAARVLTGCSPPAGPVTQQEWVALTNAVRQQTTAPSRSLETMDTNLVAVKVGPGGGAGFLARRTRSGWDVTPATTRP